MLEIIEKCLAGVCYRGYKPLSGGMGENCYQSRNMQEKYEK